MASREGAPWPPGAAVSETLSPSLVVGGGPAGMKAAITAAQRGHDVRLYEREPYLGGQLVCSEYDEQKQDLKRYKDYLITQVGKSSVRVSLGTDVTPEMVADVDPDALVLALGAYPVKLKVAGSEKNNVLTSIEAFRRADQLGEDVAIIGGGSIGCELGVNLARKGKNVTVIEIGPVLNRTLNDIMRTSLRMQMESCPTLTAYTKTAVTEIDEDSVKARREDGTTMSVKADAVIFAAGMRARLDEANGFYGITQDTNVIGDAHRVGNIWTATEEGYYIAAHM